MIPSRDGVIECLVNDIFYTFVCCNSFRFYQRTAQPNEQGPIICWNLSIALTLDSFFYKNKKSTRHLRWRISRHTRRFIFLNLF